MAGNGDERQMAAWERVEAKLDRLAEIVERQAEVLAQHGAILAQHGAILAQHGAALARLERHAEQTDRRLARLEADMDLVKVTLEVVRHETDAKLTRLKHELIDALGQQTRVELLAAQTMNEGRLASLERRVEALEAAR